MTPQRTGPVLCTDRDAVRSQRVSCALYPTSEERIADWISALPLAETGLLRGDGSDDSPEPASRARVLETLRVGAGLQLAQRSNGDGLIEVVTLSFRRPEGIRWLLVEFSHRQGESPEQHWSRCSAWFEAAIDALTPLYSYLQFGATSSILFDSRHCQPALAPVTGYYWRNYLTPELMPGRPLGDGSPAEEPMFVDFGPTPLVSLAERDRVRQRLTPFLPPRGKKTAPVHPQAAIKLQLASIDGGIEVPWL